MAKFRSSDPLGVAAVRVTRAGPSAYAYSRLPTRARRPTILNCVAQAARPRRGHELDRLERGGRAVEWSLRPSSRDPVGCDEPVRHVAIEQRGETLPSGRRSKVLAPQ